MSFHIVYVVLSCVIALLNVWVAIYAARQKRIPGARMMGLTIWTNVAIATMFVVLTATDSTAVAYASVQIRFVGLVLIGPFFLFFAIEYTQRAHWLTRWRMLAVLVPPMIFLAVLWSPLAIPHFFVEWRFTRLPEWGTEERIVGLWFNLHTVYSILTFIVAVSLIAHYAVRVDSSKRAAVLTILIGTAIALPGAAAPFLIGPPPGVRSTPISLGLLTLFIGWSFVRSTATTLMPVAYDLIFASMRDAVLLLDPLQHVISANPMCETMFRMPVNALLYKPVSTVLTLPAGSAAVSAEPATFEVELRHGDEIVTCQVQSLPLRRAAMSAGRLIVLRDITAQQAAMDLALERERSLVLAKFIEDASHEFRTPLSVIKSSAYLIGRQAESDAIHRHLRNIDEQTDRVNNLINDLQLMTVLDSGRAPTMEPVNVRDIVRMAIDGYTRSLADAKRQTLAMTADTDVSSCMGDSAELAAAMQKVLDNAVRYTPEGGRIDVSVMSCANGVCVTVRDSGIGMDDETAQAALKRFFRYDRARTTAGFGLGLPIARRIMERHGGTLTVASTAGAGTTVVLTLPAAPIGPARM